ncbi:hypothetical protein F5877DRAFT_76679 [Lentinula edodes]|nr:hypothetical protein F5877DRAFT_76679 [Lentinula edodes]
MAFNRSATGSMNARNSILSRVSGLAFWSMCITSTDIPSFTILQIARFLPRSQSMSFNRSATGRMSAHNSILSRISPSGYLMPKDWKKTCSVSLGVRASSTIAFLPILWLVVSKPIQNAFYQTDEAVAQLVIDTGLTSAQVKNWFNHRRRVLREKEFEKRRIATKQHHEGSSEMASKSLCSSNASSPYSTSKPSLPPISSMFPEIFNSEYDYTLPPDVHPIELPAHTG